ILGAYYREWLTGERLYSATGCQDAARIYIWADVDQRTLETGRAFAETLLPGCGLAIHSQPDRQHDPIFSGARTPDAELAAKAVRERLGAHPEKPIADHAAALATLHFILAGDSGTPGLAISSSATGSTLSEDFLLEYANGLTGADLGWGRLTKENLSS